MVGERELIKGDIIHIYPDKIIIDGVRDGKNIKYMHRLRRENWLAIYRKVKFFLSGRRLEEYNEGVQEQVKVEDGLEKTATEEEVIVKKKKKVHHKRRGRPSKNKARSAKVKSDG